MERCFGGIEVTRLKGHLALLKPGLRLDWVRCLLSRVHRSDAPHVSLQGTERTGREKERRGDQQDSRAEFHFFQFPSLRAQPQAIPCENSSADAALRGS